jgi:1-acyl-sn-glycerol-3-phosphate acyltransferase
MVFSLAFIYLCVYWVADPRRTLIAYRANRVLISVWFFMVGIRVKEQGKEKIEVGKTYVFISNHTNILDMPMSGYFLQHYCKALAKKELRKIPGLGFLFVMTSIMVDRSSPESRSRSMQALITYLREGTSIMLFPEGTRNRTTLPLKDFHRGAFRTAIEAQVPILPFVFLNIRHLQPVDTFWLTPGTVTIQVLDPIETTGMNTADSGKLLDTVHQMMTAAIVNGDDLFKKNNP